MLTSMAFLLLGISEIVFRMRAFPVNSSDLMRNLYTKDYCAYLCTNFICLICLSLNVVLSGGF